MPSFLVDRISKQNFYMRLLQALVTLVISILFQNHPQRHMKRKIHDFLTAANVNRKNVIRNTFGKHWCT